MHAPSRMLASYPLRTADEDWFIPEETVPESQPHDTALDALKQVLIAACARLGWEARVARNLAIRFDAAEPRFGIDPDLCILSPPPPDVDDLESLLLWRPEHLPPRLSVEVVSANNARKDYVIAPDRHAASGCEELWVFDPRLKGPRALGGPHRLQLWSRQGDTFTLVYAGAGPVRSPTLGAWLHAADEGRRLRLAEDEAGTVFWPTSEEHERAEKERERAEKEHERAEKERERAEKEHERAEKEAALVEVAALRARMAAEG